MEENAAGSPQGPPRHARVGGKRGRQSTRTTAPRTGERKNAARSPQGPLRRAQVGRKKRGRQSTRTAAPRTGEREKERRSQSTRTAAPRAGEREKKRRSQSTRTTARRAKSLRYAQNKTQGPQIFLPKDKTRAAGGGEHVGVGARCGARGRKQGRGARRGSRMRQKYDENRQKSTEIDRYRDTATQRNKRATTGIVPGRCLNLSRAEQIPRGPKNTYRVCLDEPLVSCEEIVLCPGEFPVSLDECPAMSGAV